MIIGLDHIAIAVPDLEKAISRFMEDFGLTFKGKEDVTDAKTSTAFFPLVKALFKNIWKRKAVACIIFVFAAITLKKILSA